MTSPASRLRALLTALRTHLFVARMLLGSGLVAPMRPDKYLRQAQAVRTRGAGPLAGFTMAAIRAPRATALIDERGSLTFAEVEEQADAIAAGLLDLLGGRPRTIALMARNHRGFVTALAGATRLGVDLLLLNTAFSGPQLRDVLEREQVGAVVYDEEFAGIVAVARAGIDDLVEVLAWVDAPAPTLPTLDGLVTAFAGRRPATGERRGSVVLLTSGTTGAPKGAKGTGGSGGAPALAAMLERIPWRARETVVVAAPMFHAWGFGQLVIAATMTCTVVMKRRFDPESTMALVDQHRATGLAVVPVMLERITALPAETLDRYSGRSLRFVTASGSRMRPDAVLAFMDRFGDVVCNSYNATETGFISTATPADLRVAADTAGRPLTGCDVALLDDAWRPVPVGEVGRICVRSKAQFAGYTNGETKDFHAGYMVSGDVGRFDADGRLYVVGRDDDMIVSGGENVYPIEVEKVLATHPDVVEVAVVGVEDHAFGQRLAAHVVLSPGSSATDDDLRALVRGRLAGYQVPRDVVRHDALPRNATGKVLTRELAALSSSAAGDAAAGTAVA